MWVEAEIVECSADKNVPGKKCVLNQSSHTGEEPGRPDARDDQCFYVSTFGVTGFEFKFRALEWKGWAVMVKVQISGYPLSCVVSLSISPPYNLSGWTTKVQVVAERDKRELGWG